MEQVGQVERSGVGRKSESSYIDDGPELRKGETKYQTNIKRDRV